MAQGAQRQTVGRYALLDRIASGGMGTVHLGRLEGPSGFARTVAIKRLHDHLAGDPAFVTMLMDEARLAARIRHPNVVPTLDVVQQDGEALIVLEYVHGEGLNRLCHSLSGRGLPVNIAVSVMTDVLTGLHAAHEARDERGRTLGIVHRDVSPQNVLVGADGVSRVLDFGVAKAMGRAQQTEDGALKGKLGYMSPEQLQGQQVDLRSDVFAAAIVLWECLTGTRLFPTEMTVASIASMLDMPIERPSSRRAEVPPALDEVVMKGLARNVTSRFQSCREMAKALEGAVAPATPRVVAEWMSEIADASLTTRASKVSAIEQAAAPVTLPPTGGEIASSPSRAGALSASKIPSRPPPRNAWTVRSAVMGAVVIGVGIGSYLALSVEPAPEPVAPSSESLDTPSDTRAPRVTPTAPAQTGSSAATGSTSSAAAPSGTSSATAAPTVASPPPARPPPRPVSTAKRPPPPPPKPKVDCSRPFIIDAQGNKKPRPECFR